MSIIDKILRGKMKNTGKLVQKSITQGEGVLTDRGALSVQSGKHTGRCPEAKFIVKDEKTQNTVDWSANQEMTAKEWSDLKAKVTFFKKVNIDHGAEFFTVYAAAGKKTRWESRTRKVFKFICENAKQALFIQNMFEKVELDPNEHLVVEGTVYCLPSADSNATVAINFTEKFIIICGTDYLGEIKKSVFTYMNYVLTDVNVLPMHCSVNVDLKENNPAIFFGLSGTGKTTLSSSPGRILLGDDEHAWTTETLFNIESGCYAKTIDLSLEREPEIFKAVNQFGTILENVVLNKGEADYSDSLITKNGRASYPLTHLENHVESGCVFKDPVNIVMLTCDAFGVLPAISLLSNSQAREMFLVGYTSKVAGTEVGIDEPIATFSSCFGAPFLPRAPSIYADLLDKFVRGKNINCWLVNTGWAGGPYGVGSRMDLKITRSLISSILDGTMARQSYFLHEYTGLKIPRIVPCLTSFDTRPEKSWENIDAYKKEANILMSLIDNEKSKLSS